MQDTTKQMMGELQSVRGCGITTDAWRCLATEDYVTYTLHYITDDWKLNSKVLSTYCLEERHTAENLAKEMKLMEERWSLDKLFFPPVYVHDNATNITKAPKTLDRNETGCLAHAINLVACAATSVPEVSSLLKKGRAIVGTFKRSNIANTVLKRKQILLLPNKQHKLIHDCPTRWNSSFDMLERLSEQLEPMLLLMQN